MGVKLKERVNGDGTTTFYLDIFFNKKRWTEFLTSIKLTNKPSNPAERQANKENRATAKKIAIARAAKLQGKKYKVETEEVGTVIVLDWMKDYAKKYTKADIRVIDGIINRFGTFLSEKKLTGLLMEELNNSIVKQFKEKLEKECIGEGARSYWNRFKKIIRQAYEDGLLERNPCEGVPAPKGKAKEKDTLTPEEIQLIANTQTEAPEVKRAFLFSTQTGLRWCDVSVLTWDSINRTEREARFMQAKTERLAVVSLNETAIALLGQEKDKKELVFPGLPTSANGANKSLKALVKRAKVEKKITWHCGRHSAGKNMMDAGAEIYTVAKQLGQAGITHTLRYVRESKELKQKAVDSLPGINLNSRIVEEGDTFSVISTPKKEKKPAKKKNKSAK